MDVKFIWELLLQEGQTASNCVIARYRHVYINYAPVGFEVYFDNWLFVNFKLLCLISLEEWNQQDSCCDYTGVVISTHQRVLNFRKGSPVHRQSSKYKTYHHNMQWIWCHVSLAGAFWNMDNFKKKNGLVVITSVCTIGMLYCYEKRLKYKDYSYFAVKVLIIYPYIITGIGITMKCLNNNFWSKAEHSKVLRFLKVDLGTDIENEFSKCLSQKLEASLNGLKNEWGEFKHISINSGSPS